MDFIRSTIGDRLDYIAENFPKSEALVYADRGIRLNYREFNEVCRETARGFLAMGIKKGDHVAIWATNYAEWVYTLFACAKIGAVLVTVNTNYKLFELEYLMRQSDSMTLIMCGGIKGVDYVQIARELLPELDSCEPGQLKSERLPLLKNVVYLDREGMPPRAPGMFIWSDVMSLAARVSNAELDAAQRGLHYDDVINIQYTSGTTGFPKGVMLTHFNILNNGYFIGENMKFTENDRLCICVPFFHCFGLVLAMMAAFSHATAMVPVEVYQPLKVLETLEAERCTAVHGVPTMFIFMLEHPEFDKFDLSTLRTGIMAGSTCPIQVMRSVVEKMNMSDIVIVFGQTECSPGMTMSKTTDPLELRVSTVGRLLPNCEGKIIDPETGAELPPDTPGEIVTRGYHVMRGYYNMPEASAQAVDREGWLHTGDIGTMDADGYFRITGRIKDMIIRGGENIYPREIEELLYLLDGIQDVQVVGAPSRKFGEEVAAFVILKEGASLTEDDVKNFVREKMARHKVPSYVEFVEAFPITASGKIQKYILRDQIADKLKSNGHDAV